MVDLETLSTNPTAQILSIGAVKFTENGIQDEFYINLKIKEGAEWFDLDKETLKWWNTQNPEVIHQAIENSVPYQDGFKKFLEWYGNYSLPIWSNGADFDIPILKHHCRTFGEVVPWHYRDIKCYRTVTSLLGDLLPIERTGNAHNALDDAKSQANHIIQLLQ